MAQRYVRLDATRAFYLATLTIALMGGSFAAGLRLGQDMPAHLESVFSGPSQNEMARPVLAPEQHVPVETYTFYDSQRELEREPVVVTRPELPQRVISREPVEIAVAEPSGRPTPDEVAPIPAPAEAPATQAPIEPSEQAPGHAAVEAAPAAGAVPDNVVEDPGNEAGGEVVAAPARIERQTVVRSIDEVDGF